MWIARKPILMACLLTSLAQVNNASAAPIAEDWNRLVSQALTDGAAPVVIDLANVSLVELKYGGEKITSRVNGYAAALLAELGDGVWSETVNVLRNGQMTAYLTSSGLFRLRNSAAPLAFRAGQGWSQQSRLHRSEIDLEKINQRIRALGSANVRVLMNVEGLAFDLTSDGSPKFTSTTAASNSFQEKLKELSDRLNLLPHSLAATSIQSALSRQSDVVLNPSIMLTINRRELVSLGASGAIRDIRLEDGSSDEVDRLYVEPTAFALAAAHGQITAIVSFRNVVASGNLSRASEEAYWQSMRKVMNVTAAKYGGLPGMTALANLNVMVGSLTHSELLAIAQNPDASIKSIIPNHAVGVPALTTANPAMGLPLVWNTSSTRGFITGAGTTIAILDTGVQSSHDFFRSTGGGSRVVQEACFGTTDSTYLSICPAPQDSAFDSNGPGTGQALFCPSSLINCSHGTSVAGLAAGGYFTGSGAGAVYSTRSGAYKADIHSYVVVSKERSSGGMRMQAVDALAALSRVISVGQASVVNMSLAKSLYSGVCNGSVVPLAERATFDAAQTAVNILFDRGVAVVAATGNDGAAGQIAFPACLSKVVKVGAIPNKSPIYNYNSTITNLPLPYAWSDFIFMAPGGGMTYGENNTHMSLPVYPNSWNSQGGGGTSWAAPLVSSLFSLYKSSTYVSSTVTEIGNYLKGAGRTYKVYGQDNQGIAYPYNEVGPKYIGIKFTAL